MSLQVPSQLQEAHYCRLQSQSNVYGLSKIAMPCGHPKLLVASLRGKVMSMEFQKTRPSSREVHFTYIPSDAEIVSIDAFNKTHYGSGAVVGITFIKTSDNKPCQFLNIYSEYEPGSEFNLDVIAQGCQNLELNFLPYQLCHAELAHAGAIEMVFLLSGNDQSVHLFREDRYRHTFSEESTVEFFPEFKDIASCIVWIDCQSFDEYRKRITAYGCQNGLIQMSVVDTRTKEILQCWCVQHDSPITSVQLFTLHTDIQCPSFLDQIIDNEEDGSESESTDFQLVVASALECTVIYRNVLEKGVRDPTVLANSDTYDSVLCVCVTDIDFDGQNEILLGTYGQELLVYKYQPRIKASSELKRTASESESESSIDSTSRQLDTPNSSGRSAHSHRLLDGDFRLLWQRSFADPLLALSAVDMTGDGVKEVLVLSLKGLHILQHNLSEVAELCLEGMKHASQQSPQEDVFKQLLSENLSSS